MNNVPSSCYSLPSDAEIIALFKNLRSIAVIGLSPKANRPSHRVTKHMQQFSFDIIPVCPAVIEILGKKAYASLQDIPCRVDLVNVFRAPRHVAEITDQCIDKKLRRCSCRKA